MSDTISRMNPYRPPGSVSTVSVTVVTEALRDPTVLEANLARVASERDRLRAALQGVGWTVGPSVTNFLLVGLTSREHAAEVAEGTRFELHDSRAAAVAAADGPHLTYLTYFPGPVGGLKPGTPVQMKGVQIGRVRDVRLRYVPQTATLETPVILEIDPRELEFTVTDTAPSAVRISE